MSRLRMAIVAALFALPACVVKLNHENDPLPNGDVTGPAADCSVVKPLGTGGPGTGAAAPKFVGRFDTRDPNRPSFDWSGTEISARFEGTEVTVGLESGAPMLLVYVLDGGDPHKFEVLPNQGGYQIAKNLSPGPHEILIHRNSEALYGVLTFTGFNFGTGGKLLPPTERPRKIEIIGDSITCGYGNEGANATCPFDVPDTTFPDAKIPNSENQYLAYGSLTGRALSADVTTLCYSGRGIYQNYRDVTGEAATLGQPTQTTPDPDSKTLMPQFYQRTLASQPDSPAWDFSKESEPQVVVIALGTNDFARDANGDSIADGIDEGLFHDKYSEFLTFVRSKRPNAHIFLATSPMLSDKYPLDNARTDFRNILHAIASEFEAKGDKKVYAMEMVEMGSRYGLGCDYHPNLAVHQVMADQLIGAIRSKTCW